jgi:hypothetical protein
MTKKSKTQENEQPPDSLSMGASKTPASKSCTAMTSCEYQHLRQGVTDENQIAAYIHFTDKFTSRDTLERELKSTTDSESQDYLKAIEHSDATFYQTVWQWRRELVAKMNLPTLEQLAKRYGIPTGSECIREHPDASDLDKGVLLARLHQFHVWDGEYFGTTPEMRNIDVEAAIEGGTTREKRWQPSDTEVLGSLLHHVSACKKANESMLLEALRDCIAMTCICQAHKKKLTAGIKNISKDIDGFGDINDYDNPKRAKTSLQILKKKLLELKGKLQEILAYAGSFTPGQSMPEIVRGETEKWFISQFTEGKPVGSIVRVAWLADVFHSFWEQYQKQYLDLDPKLKETLKGESRAYSEMATRRSITDADKKWRRFTTLFVEYVTSTGELKSKPLPADAKPLVDAFGKQLNKMKGTKDKRTSEPIEEFVSTLMTNMDRDDYGGYPNAIHELLRKNTRYNRKKGDPSGSPFATLTIETVTACIEILREGLKRSRVGQGKTRGQRPTRKP